MSKPAFHLEYPPNEKGCDYVVGDLHGELGKLNKALADIGFNRETDRLFSVGDLIDRGPDSVGVVVLALRPWFIPIQGNHEQMMLWAIERGDYNLWIVNGGDWFAKVDAVTQKCLVAQINSWPLAITINHKSGKRIGICHAEPPVENWDAIALVEENQHALQNMIWGRGRIKSENDTPVKNIDWVICGHTPVNDVAVLGNVIYIDTGACFGRKLTILKLDDQL